MNAQTILIADDCAADVTFLKQHLKAAKIVNPVQVTSDGEEAICYLKGQGRFADREQYPYPLLLFLDLKLPKVGGYEILSYLQSSPEHRNLPVIVLSGISDLKKVALAYQNGAKSFLVKPVETGELMNTLVGLKQFDLRFVQGGFRIERRPEK